MSLYFKKWVVCFLVQALLFLELPLKSLSAFEFERAHLKPLTFESLVKPGELLKRLVLIKQAFEEYYASDTMPAWSEHIFQDVVTQMDGMLFRLAGHPTSYLVSTTDYPHRNQKIALGYLASGEKVFLYQVPGEGDPGTYHKVVTSKEYGDGVIRFHGKNKVIVPSGYDLDVETVQEGLSNLLFPTDQIVDLTGAGIVCMPIGIHPSQLTVIAKDITPLQHRVFASHIEHDLIASPSIPYVRNDLFDVAILVLENSSVSESLSTRDPVAFFKEVKRLLNPGGRLIIVVSGLEQHDELVESYFKKSNVFAPVEKKQMIQLSAPSSPQQKTAPPIWFIWANAFDAQMGQDNKQRRAKFPPEDRQMLKRKMKQLMTEPSFEDEWGIIYAELFITAKLLIWKMEIRGVEPEDIVQEVLVDMFKNQSWKKYEGHGTMLAFMRGAIRKKILLAIRTASNKSKINNNAMANNALAVMPLEAAPVDESFIERERVERVMRLLFKRHPKYYRVLRLHEQGYSKEEIAAIVNMRPSSIRSSIGRARRAVKKYRDMIDMSPPSRHFPEPPGQRVEPVVEVEEVRDIPIIQTGGIMVTLNTLSRASEGRQAEHEHNYQLLKMMYPELGPNDPLFARGATDLKEIAQALIRWYQKDARLSLRFPQLVTAAHSSLRTLVPESGVTNLPVELRHIQGASVRSRKDYANYPSECGVCREKLVKNGQRWIQWRDYLIVPRVRPIVPGQLVIFNEQHVPNRFLDHPAVVDDMLALADLLPGYRILKNEPGTLFAHEHFNAIPKSLNFEQTRFKTVSNGGGLVTMAESRLWPAPVWRFESRDRAAVATATKLALRSWMMFGPYEKIISGDREFHPNHIFVWKDDQSGFYRSYFMPRKTWWPPETVLPARPGQTKKSKRKAVFLPQGMDLAGHMSTPDRHTFEQTTFDSAIDMLRGVSPSSKEELAPAKEFLTWMISSRDHGSSLSDGDGLFLNQASTKPSRLVIAYGSDLINMYHLTDLPHLFHVVLLGKHEKKIDVLDETHGVQLGYHEWSANGKVDLAKIQAALDKANNKRPGNKRVKLNALIKMPGVPIVMEDPSVSIVNLSVLKTLDTIDSFIARQPESRLPNEKRKWLHAVLSHLNEQA